MRANDRQRPGTESAGSAGGFVPEIESLRGIAITLVFLLHSDAAVTFHSPVAGRLVVSPLRAFSLGGHTGVSLFFILSGFLLGRPFLQEAKGGRHVSRSGYYVRRALRILPLYYAAVVAASVLCAQRPFEVLRGAPYLLFLNALPGLTKPLLPYSNVWWSLATEAQFYLLLPLLGVWLRSRRGRWLAGIGLLAYVLAYVAFATGRLGYTFETQMKLSHSVLGRAPLFAFGIAAGWFCDRYGERVRTWAAGTPWMRNGAADVVLLAVLLGMGLLLRRVVFVGYWAAELQWHAWHVVEGALWTAVLLLLLLAPLRCKPLLSNRFWGTIGLLSYSIYMVHSPLIIFALAGLHRLHPGALTGGWRPSTFAAVAGIAVACAAVSAVTYAVIERPFLRRKARVRSWSDATRKPAPPARATRQAPQIPG